MAVNGIIGKKIGMTQLFDDKGDVRPVTVLQAGPCVITQRKTAAKDGYEAAQIGLVEFVKQSRLTQPMKGHFGKHDLPPMRMLREVAVEVAAAGAAKAEGQEASAEKDGNKVGDKVLVDIFEDEKFVDVTGTSKGRGLDRKSTRLNSSHVSISYAVFCLKKKKLMQHQEAYIEQMDHKACHKTCV